MKTVLTIAGSDSCGGAGIQADIKTITVNRAYAMSVITALTAQNTLGVSGIYDVPDDFFKIQLEAVFNDIVPDAVKTGMIVSEGQINIISDILEKYNISDIVTDPVMISTSGSKLINDEVLCAMKKKLFPICKLITPNIPEAEVLSGVDISCADDMIRAAEGIFKIYGCNVLCKGGHKTGDADDLLYTGTEIKWYKSRRIDNPNTHGTGCTLSSAIATFLAQGFDIFTAVEKAKSYIYGTLESMLDIGRGNGPVDHGFILEK